MDEQKKNNKKGMAVLIILACLFTAGIIFSGTKLFLYFSATHDVIERQKELQSIHVQADVEDGADPVSMEKAERGEQDEEEVYVQPEWEKNLIDINSDYFGWLTVEGTNADLPVVLGSNDDYYLHHNFYCEYAAAGCLFADSACDSDSQNVVIYGHHMKDGTMFGSLKKFKSSDFFEENRTVTWEQVGKPLKEYEIFAVLVLPGSDLASDWLDIEKYINATSKDEIAAMMDTLYSRSSQWRDVDYEAGDHFLFLMTCDYSRSNGRLLVCAKEVS